MDDTGDGATSRRLSEPVFATSTHSLMKKSRSVWIPILQQRVTRCEAPGETEQTAMLHAQYPHRRWRTCARLSRRCVEGRRPRQLSWRSKQFSEEEVSATDCESMGRGW